MRKCLALAAMAVAAVLLACGCASTPKHELSQLQGTWTGEELGGETAQCWMTIEGDTIKFQGTQQPDWYIGTLSLDPRAHPKQASALILDCGLRQYVNKTTLAIYKLEGKKLTMAANEPGNEAVPGSFGRDPAGQTRAFVFTRQ
jgi:uncharacterized protein (TIGR03067 family)